MHRAEVHSKLMGIMRERLNASLKGLPAAADGWAARPPPPPGAPPPPASGFATSNAKQLRILSQVGPASTVCQRHPPCWFGVVCLLAQEPEGSGMIEQLTCAPWLPMVLSGSLVAVVHGVMQRLLPGRCSRRCWGPRSWPPSSGGWRRCLPTRRRTPSSAYNPRCLSRSCTTDHLLSGV